MLLLPPRSNRPATHCPFTTLFRSKANRNDYDVNGAYDAWKLAPSRECSTLIRVLNRFWSSYVLRTDNVDNSWDELRFVSHSATVKRELAHHLRDRSE